MAPELSYALAAEAYDYVTPWTRIYGRLAYDGRSKFFFDNVNAAEQHGYGVTDLRLGAAGERWDVALWGSNLFDTRYRTFGGDLGPPVGRKASVGDPRLFGATLTVFFLIALPSGRHHAPAPAHPRRREFRRPPARRWESRPAPVPVRPCRRGGRPCRPPPASPTPGRAGCGTGCGCGFARPSGRCAGC